LDRCKAIPVPVRHDALPRAVSVQELVRAGRVEPGREAQDESVIQAADDLGATPNLYAGPSKKFGSSSTIERLLKTAKTPKDEDGTASVPSKRVPKPD
jgi:hypothetical protein